MKSISFSQFAYLFIKHDKRIGTQGQGIPLSVSQEKAQVFMVESFVLSIYKTTFQERREKNGNSRKEMQLFQPKD